MATPRLLILSIWVLSTLTSFLMGHSYMTSPITRQNQAQTNTGCCPGNLASSTNKSPNQNLCTATCDGPKQGNPPPKDSVKVYKRGDQIKVEWPRNNHTGGFVRLSLASYDKTDNQQSFDENIFHLSCYESHCRADLLSDLEGLDSNPPNGSKNPCFTYAHIPSWLSDGAYSLQWVWYGGGQALGEYYSCSDLYIEGGPTEPKSKPIFTGGDPFTTESGQCRYFNNANNLGVCAADNCPNRAPPQIGVPAGEFKTWTNVIEAGEGATNLPMADRKCNEKQLPEPDRLIRDGTGRPVCGKNNPNSTCPFGMCCSAAGFCGPFKESDGSYKEGGRTLTEQQAFDTYCSQNQGDWRSWTSAGICFDVGLSYAGVAYPPQKRSLASPQAQSTGGSSSNLPVILGGVFGGLAFALMLVGAAKLYRKRNPKDDTQKPMFTELVVPPSDSQNGAGNRFLPPSQSPLLAPQMSNNNHPNLFSSQQPHSPSIHSPTNGSFSYPQQGPVTAHYPPTPNHSNPHPHMSAQYSPDSQRVSVLSSSSLDYNNLNHASQLPTSNQWYPQGDGNAHMYSPQDNHYRRS